MDDSIRKAKSISELFVIVKRVVKEYLGVDQAGLMVGTSDLGVYRGGFIGAFYSLNSNMIIINKRPLARVKKIMPTQYNYYLFHILLHEYIHSIGSYDEEQTRHLVFEISQHYFGKNHPVTEFSVNMSKILPKLGYSDFSFEPPLDTNVDFELGIDKENIDYIN